MIPLVDCSFFSTVAGSAAALLGLSFFALIFFLTDLFKRYKGLVLPVHHEMLRHRLQSLTEEIRKSPEYTTDYALFDGDPLVVFSAFSVGVTWNMYFVALVLSLTALSGKLANVWVLVIELLAFWCFLAFSLQTRNAKRDELATYRTRDEHLWIFFEWAFVGLWFLGAVLTFIAAWSVEFRTPIWLAFWLKSDIDNMTMVSSILKIISLGGLFFGLYVTNKDLFVYFKAKSSDQMRGNWLLQFVKERYPTLVEKVRVALVSQDGPENAKLKKLWNEGCPPASYVRYGFSPLHGLPDDRWNCLLSGKHCVASWMFDVPGIALWVTELERKLLYSKVEENS